MTHTPMDWHKDEFPTMPAYSVTRDVRESETPVTGGPQRRKWGKPMANRKTRRMVRECLSTGIMPTTNRSRFTQWDIS